MQGIFLEGIAVGFCLAAPVGPIAALCLQRTTTEGKLAGIATGIGAALADAFYGSLAALGVTAVSSFLAVHRDIMLRAGGVVLLVLGARLLFAKAAERAPKPDGAGLVRDLLSTLALTLTNPMTFVAFAAVFAALGLHAGHNRPLLTLQLVLGVFTGSLAWWLVLVALATVLQGRMGGSGLVWMNRAVGVFVIVVGVLYLTGVAGALVRSHAPPPS